jgi:hypothetical protein
MIGWLLNIFYFLFRTKHEKLSGTYKSFLIYYFISFSMKYEKLAAKFYSLLFSVKYYKADKLQEIFLQSIPLSSMKNLKFKATTNMSPSIFLF